MNSRPSAQLVVQTAFLGDVILTTPLLRHLAAQGPVDIVTTPAAAQLLARNPSVREVIVFDKRGEAKGLRGLTRLARTLRGRSYGAAYLAQASVRSGALATLARIPERIGFETAAGRRFYTRRIPFRDDLHHAERLLRLALSADASPVPREMLRPELFPAADDEAAASAVLREGALEQRDFVVLAPGSVWATKRWPYYADLAALLAMRLGIVVVGSAADGQLASAILSRARESGGTALDATGRLSLLGSAALIGRARALITNDSAPLHLGSATGTPTLAIFGPTVPDFGFGPLAPRGGVLGRESLPCRPCDRHGPQRCPLGHWRCMREIAADDVASMLDELLTNLDH
jgi:heptosyltransferase II